MLAIDVAAVAAVWLAIGLALIALVLHIVYKVIFGRGGKKVKNDYTINRPYLDNKDMAFNSNTCSKGVIGERCSALDTGVCNEGVI
ncbi:hypothetical protein LJB87_00210 [Alistipes sp. OttesenSCG-928-L06]|nr:hypothetical protein [Alistipes sp. OttesenSCG-928-L06]